MHILYLTSEQWPTFRADIVALFGKYLPRLGVTCDLVTEADLALKNGATKPVAPWPAGRAILCDCPKSRALQYIVKLLHQCRVLLSTDYKKYDAIQVRDMTVIALLAICMAKLNKIPFFYWLSYPQSEGQIQRAQARGLQGGMRYWFPLLQGHVGKWLLYKIILPKADHIFVQSAQMQRDIAKHGICFASMTPVPMGVDLEIAKSALITPTEDERLKGKRSIIYLGTLDRVRKIDILFEMLQIVKQKIPNITLVIAGDTEDPQHRTWLTQQAARHGVEDYILWTGWLPTHEAWRYVVKAEIGLSPFPRGYLLDMSSPTKAIEYMALGLPVVMNDNPDQAQIVQESDAGICVALSAQAFAIATIELLNNPASSKVMVQRGKQYVMQKRSYETIAMQLSAQYQQLKIKNNEKLHAKDFF